MPPDLRGVAVECSGELDRGAHVAARFLAGYVLWCLWLIAVAVVLLRSTRRRGAASHAE